MNMKKVLLTILVVLTSFATWAQNDGSACEKAIYVDSTLVQKVEANTVYWFTATTDDLPLTVYFFPDEDSAADPQVYVDFTCTSGVYEDENIREIVDLAASMEIYFPLGADFEIVEINGHKAYTMSYERDLIELLAMLGIDYSIPVYVAFMSPVDGTVQMNNVKTEVQCTALHQRVEMRDTLYLQSNKEGLFYFPVKEWKDKKMSFTWTGSTPIRAYLETDCDFDTLTSEYTYKFATKVNGYYTQQISETSIQNYIRDAEDGNMYVMFKAPETGKVYVTNYVDHSLTIDDCIDDFETDAINFPLTQGLTMQAKAPSTSYRIETDKLRNKNIRLKWQTTENKLAVLYFANFCGFELKASAPDVVDTIHLVYNEEMQCMTADIPMERINKIADQHTDGWLFMQLYRQEAGTFSWDTYEVQEPDCDSKSLLLKSTDSIVMPANHYNTSYKLVADEWKKFANTITWRGTRKAFVFIADTCSFSLAPYNIHVGKYIELNPNQSVELSQKELATLAKNYADPDGNLYLRLRSDAEGALVTCQSKPQDVTVELDVKACDSYTWHGTTYTKSGTYEHLGQTTLGADSLEILHLTINYSAKSEETATACDSYTWNGTVYTTSGIYRDTLTTVHGCDSIVTLHLTINKSYNVEEPVVACDTYTWPLDGNTYTTSGDYVYRGKTISGCDSIVTLHLTINKSYNVEEPVVACDTYTWSLDGNTYTTSGDYVYTGKTISGCDSIVTLKLTVNKSDKVEETVVACDTYTWPLDGNTYTTSGDYVYTGKTISGCDSIVTLKLTVNKSYNVEEPIVACDTYTWPLDGNTYTTSGDYVYTGTTISGCDSIAILKLTINYSDTAEFTATTCEPYLWNGKEYAESGTYTYLTQTALGCDSLMILHLTVQCDNTALDNVTINGRKSQLVMINNSLYIQVDDINGIRYYDLVGRPVKFE